MEIFYRTLEIINYICCAISTVLFAIQLIYILFIWLPPKHFKESTHYHKMAVLIVARNESDVIGETVKSLLDQQTYPKDRFDVFVCADNCTDDTEAKAKAAGAITYTHSDPDPAHHRAAFPVQYAMNEILKDYPGVYDAFIRFDADNHDCAIVAARKVKRPDPQKLLSEARKLGVAGVARKYGVVDSVYRKWLSEAGLPNHRAEIRAYPAKEEKTIEEN